MVEHNSRYETLKTKILEAAVGTSFSMAQIKEEFASCINSKRALSRVSNLSSFICLLEERDLINNRNISYLQELAKLLQNDKMKELLHNFKKLYLDEIEEKMCTCGVDTSPPDYSPMPEQQRSQCLSRNNNNYITEEMTQAFQNISKSIGKQWVLLARALDIPEGLIEEIREENPFNYEQHALDTLNIWLRKQKENASRQLLDQALNSKDCLRFGLGSFLLEPRILLT